jgi:hypothetical protein
MCETPTIVITEIEMMRELFVRGGETYAVRVFLNPIYEILDCKLICNKMKLNWRREGNQKIIF